MAAIAAICLSAMFLNVDAVDGFLNTFTRSFNAIVAFSDAYLNGIVHPLVGNSNVSDILNLLVFLELLGSIYNYIFSC